MSKPVEAKNDNAPPGYQVSRYKESRHWGVWDAAGELVCVAVYKKGANEVRRRLMNQAATTITEEMTRK